MISRLAHFTIQRIPLECLQVKEYQTRYPSRLNHYIHLMEKHPDKDAGFLVVVPSDTHPGMHVILDGHHRYVAAIMTGRPELLCVIVQEPKPVDEKKLASPGGERDV